MVAYPDISFLTFFGVHFRFTHILCLIFSLLFSGTSLFMASAHSFSPKTYPNILFLTFLGVRASSHFTYCGFSTLLFTKNVPQHFIFAISRGTTLHHTIHTLPPTTHKSILWRRFAPEYAFFSFSCVSNSVSPTGRTSPSLLAIHLRRYQRHQWHGQHYA